MYRSKGIRGAPTCLGRTYLVRQQQDFPTTHDDLDLITSNERMISDDWRLASVSSCMDVLACLKG